MLVIQNPTVTEQWEEITILLQKSRFWLRFGDDNGDNVFHIADDDLPFALPPLYQIQSLSDRTLRWKRRGAATHKCCLRGRIVPAMTTVMRPVYVWQVYVD
jgi:hypothetical protein